MKLPKTQDILPILLVLLAICMVLRGWDAVISFLGILLTAIIPLLLGTGIAYVVSIPTSFLCRHFLPQSDSEFVRSIRKPVALFVVVTMILVILVVSSIFFVPALLDTVSMVQKNGEHFVFQVVDNLGLEPVRVAVHDFMSGDLMQNLKNLKIGEVVKDVFGGTVGSITTQLFSVVNTLMTGFFGLVFSFILLTDTTDVGDKIMGTIASYLGPTRAERMALVLGITDSSFHNFIVRQCIEAGVLGTVGTLILLLLGFPFALGVGVFMGLAALIPIVGYPIGLFVGAFMVAIYNVWFALAYLVVVGLAQMLESSLLLPHVGDPRTVLPPVWVMVAVTIGGGVAGFVGMLVAIPIASSIRQLVLTDVRRRRIERGWHIDEDDEGEYL